MGKLTSTIGIPIKLLNEAQGHVVTLEITSGVVYRGKLLEAEDNMNVQLKDITVTARDGRVSHLDQVYIRGSHVKFFIVPDMLRNAPMFRSRGQRGRGVGLARGKATPLIRSSAIRLTLHRNDLPTPPQLRERTPNSQPTPSPHPLPKLTLNLDDPIAPGTPPNRKRFIARTIQLLQIGVLAAHSRIFMSSCSSY
ncbi:hypothetical protein CNMCM8694_001955 [Aspergillus lentulus]|nr:hypothetical protein CNMCM8694_001955 [Aspergillus lentulus]